MTQTSPSDIPDHAIPDPRPTDRGPPDRGASRGYPRFVLGVLFLVYVFNFVDRRILAILIEPIKRDLGVSDTMMGLLTGTAFALFYTAAGVVIARGADVWVRRTVIALGLALWSAMTALMGLARGTTELALARIGVGLGEAACSPPAHSLIADYFPPARRATALSIYSMGIYVGILISYLAGGALEQRFGWRATLVIVGLPGLLLAVVVRFAIREPARGPSPRPRPDGPDGPDGEGPAAVETAPPVRAVLAHLWRLRAFRHLALGAALNSFVGYALGHWLASFLVRVHGMTLADATPWLGLGFGIGGAVGVLAGGLLCDFYARTDVRHRLRIPAIATWLSLPVTAAALLWPGPFGACLLVLPSIVLGALYLGPVFAVTQSLVGSRMRALAASVLLLVINVIGLGLGPLLVGATSDALTDIPAVGDQALRYALLAAVAVRLWAGWHLWRGAEHLPGELGDTA